MTPLDDYLVRLRRELQASPEETEEVLREVRSHLELAALDIGRNGRDATYCLAQALDSFGAAEYIGRELRQAHGRATWLEAGWAALPLFLFGGWMANVLQIPAWAAPLALVVATVAG
jgi:hypothetical protein